MFDRRPRPSSPDEDAIEAAQTYGRSFADVYDDWYGEVTDAEATARFVADRCGEGPVLELGVGTGRLARPLQALGLPVVGVDVSAEMLAGCVDRRRGLVPVVQADMTELPLRGPVGAVLLGFNTLFNLPSADRQRLLFAALRPCCGDDAVVVVETLSTAALAGGPRRSVAASRYHDDGITIVAANLDPERQTILGQHIDLRSGGVTHRPWLLRWARPEEIDRYAGDAGFELVERYSDWHLSPYDAASSGSQVSVYRPGPT